MQTKDIENNQVIVNSEANNNQDNYGLSVIAPEKMQELGLSESDREAILKTTAELKEFTNESVSNFGVKLSQTAVNNVDELLSKVKGGELGEIGKKIVGVVAMAQNLKYNKLVDEKKSLGSRLLGKTFDRIMGKKNEVMLSYKDVNSQLEIMVESIDGDIKNLELSSNTLNETILYNYTQIKQLSVYMAAGQINLEKMKKRMDELNELNQNDADVAAEKYTLNQAIISMEKRLHDFYVLQYALQQQIPMIDIIAKNNADVINKFNEVKIITLPILKGNLVMQISLNDQMQSVEMIDTLRDMTGNIMKQNALDAKRASVEVARSNQESSIKVEDLIQSQAIFEETWDELKKIQENRWDTIQQERKKLEEQRTRLKEKQLKTIPLVK
ncbi:TPA: toxic anion resistance protein [Acinetobacter baumannii]|uniref:toxic anion resistance protein n=1 Tax=Acinetobacter baumannii TaxID=470 RepID=UPI002258725F|nr:toxic anion resistance protein [Acinetobacter baumannii]MCX3034190.1 toxic anion resistance protein [Acinetobacter baumannii]